MVRVRFLSILALWLGAMPAAFAERFPTPNQSVRIDYFEVDNEELIKLIVTPKQPLREVDFRKEIASLIDAEKAALFGTVEANANKGAQVGVHREFLYPTEGDPPEIPYKVQGPIAAGVNLITPPSPTAYDMRTLGPWLSVRTHKESEFPAWEIYANWTFLRGYQVFGRAQSRTRVPVFYGMSTSAVIAERPDKDILLGVFTPPPARKEDLPRDTSRRIVALLRQTGDTPGHEPPKKGTGQNVGILVTHVSIPWNQWTEVRNPAMTEKELWQSVTGNDSPGRIIETAYATGVLREKAKLHSTFDWPRRGSGDPAELPQSLHGPIDPEVELATHVGITSTYIDRVGHVIEFEAVEMRQKDVFALKISPEFFDAAGTAEYGKSFNAKKQSITSAPIISTQQLYVTAGHPVLLAMTRSDEAGGDQPSMILTFVRLDSFPP